MDTIPIFDWSNWPLALTQLILVIALPILVGLVTDRLTASWIKVLLLGGLSFASVVLTALVYQFSGGEPDWPNVIGNGLVTWALGIVTYLGVLKNLNVVQKAQESKAIQVFDRGDTVG